MCRNDVEAQEKPAESEASAATSKKMQGSIDEDYDSEDTEVDEVVIIKVKKAKKVWNAAPAVAATTPRLASPKRPTEDTIPRELLHFSKKSSSKKKAGGMAAAARPSGASKKSADGDAIGDIGSYKVVNNYIPVRSHAQNDSRCNLR